MRAIDFAAQRHRFHKRKDEKATAYINHPIRVAMTLVEAGEDDLDLLIAAVLHDTIEDTKTTAEEIEDVFGKEVASLVIELTDDKQLEKEERKRLQIERAKCHTLQARKLKLADKICNVGDILSHPPHGWSEDRKVNYIEWAKQVVDQIRGTQPVLEQQFDELYRQAREKFRSLHGVG